MKAFLNKSAQGRLIYRQSEHPVAEAVFEIEAPELVERWVACYRPESCWMVPGTGRLIADIPDETQMLLFKTETAFVAYFAVVSDRFRASIFADTEGRLCARVESGCPEVKETGFDLVYVLEGDDPYMLMEQAAMDMRGGSRELKRPDFMRWFGWCSWNAFYDKVSEENIQKVLDRFQEAGLVPGFIIVDVGWQQSEGNYLTGTGCVPEKFPNGMRAAIDGIKSRYGVEKVLLWQSYNGYWNGLASSFPGSVRIEMEPPERLLSGRPFGPKGTLQIDTMSDTFYPEHIMDQPFRHPEPYAGFYDEYHAASRASGADGVKIDAITWIEAFGKKRGGRVAMMKRFIDAAERSVDENFGGEIIWCSSCSNDFILNTNGSGVVRTSMDFFPDKPETHGMHVFANAINSLYMGAFCNPDWDMFQSALGAPSAFHAAARAISGGPVYSTDAFGEEDFDLIRKVALPDGSVPLCEAVAKPSLDSIFADVQESLFKVYNTNPCGHVLGIFNCAYGEDQNAVLAGPVSVSDIHPLRDNSSGFAIFSQNNQSIERVSSGDERIITLGVFGFELLTVVEIRDGFAPIGDPGMYNSGGVVRAWRTVDDEQHVELMRARGFTAWCEQRPVTVTFKGEPIDFSWDGTRLSLPLAGTSCGELVVGFQGIIEKSG